MSGGAVRGAAQVGMLREVLTAGIFPDAVVAVSAGALNGLPIANDPSLDQVEMLEGLWREVSNDPPVRSGTLRTLVSILRGRPGFDTGERLRKMIEENVPVVDLGNTLIPIHVGTTAASTGRLCWWSDGPSVDILCASAAIPGVFPAVPLTDGDLHMDGGVLSNLPLRYAVTLQPTRLVVFDVAADFLPPEKQTALTLMLTGFRAATTELTRQEWLDVPVDIEVLHIELPDPSGGLDLDFGDTDLLFEEGAGAGRAAIAASGWVIPH
ncbi:MAG: patatin-like phospholipase family protein [Actinomycetota bacterium]|nr:patatin-like phospholipase family protein [Actinomycetota bacterium]